MPIDWSTVFNFPEEYDSSDEVPREDIPFFVKRAKESGGPVLELACGTGRITIPIAKQGIEIVGVDASAKMLGRAREKAKQEGLDIRWLEADYRSFALGRKFSLIFIAYHSICHIIDFHSFQRLFLRIGEHLNDDGTLIFDCWNPGGESLGLMGDTRLSPAEVLKVNRLKWFKGDTSQTMTYFYPREFEALAQGFGFRVVEMLGDSDGSPYEPTSRRLISVFEKAR